MPGRAVSGVDLDRLRIAGVAFGVTAPVGQIDAPDERNVATGCVVMTEDEQFLMVAPTPPHSLINEHDAASAIDLIGESTFFCWLNRIWSACDLHSKP